MSQLPLKFMTVKSCLKISVKMLTFLLVAALAGCSFAAPPVPKTGIVRPCHLQDLQCITDNLAANSQCNTQVTGFVPEQYSVKVFKYDTPYFNATYIDNNLIVRNHDKCYVSEFFFNMDTDVAVLALDCPNLDLESNRTLIQHRSYMEDSYYHMHIRGLYPLIRLTINMNQANALDLCTSFAFADVAVLPIFQLEPSDKPTANFLSTDLSFLSTYERENMYAKGNELARTYINNLICDFGCL